MKNCFYTIHMAIILFRLFAFEFAITQLITWALSLPMQFLSQIMSCVTSFISQIAGGISSVMSAIGGIVSAIGCEPYTCQTATSLSDIGDTMDSASQGASTIAQKGANVGYSVGNMAGKLV